AKDFRFAMRAWELYKTDSVCTGCATGCAIEIHHKDNRTYRLVPRHNDDVNKHWMCDEGRMTYKGVHKDRLASPLLGGLPTSWDKALAAAAQKLAASQEAGGLAVVLSATHTNEENYLLARLAREFLGIDQVYWMGRMPAPERADKILRDADLNPNSVGAIA